MLFNEGQANTLGEAYLKSRGSHSTLFLAHQHNASHVPRPPLHTNIPPSTWNSAASWPAVIDSAHANCHQCQGQLSGMCRPASIVGRNTTGQPRVELLVFEVMHCVKDLQILITGMFPCPAFPHIALIYKERLASLFGKSWSTCVRHSACAWQGSPDYNCASVPVWKKHCRVFGRHCTLRWWATPPHPSRPWLHLCWEQ